MGSVEPLEIGYESPAAPVDAALVMLSEFDPQELYRVLRPGGWIVDGACAPGSLMGELTEVLSPSHTVHSGSVGPNTAFA